MTKLRWVDAIFLHITASKRLFDHHQALQVLALGEMDGHRVVGRTLQPFADATLHAGVDAGRGDDLVKQVGADAAGAG
jgi:hypothetical protein